MPTVCHFHCKQAPKLFAAHQEKVQHEITNILFAANQGLFDVSCRTPSPAAAFQFSYLTTPSISVSYDVVNLSELA
jgi:hypothetical protein